MSKLPKLKVKYSWGYPTEEIMDLEEARYRFQFDGDTVHLIEGELVPSYAELVELASQDKYKDIELIEVVLVASMVTGG